jgi:hypothetical protein
MNIWIGIDPGLTGAVAFITENGKYGVKDTPVIETCKKKVSKKSGKKYKSISRKHNPAAMAAIIQKAVNRFGKENVLVAIEKVHSMPGQGVAAMFSMGEGYGIWQGIIGAIGVRLEFVTPQKWKSICMHGMDKSVKGNSVIKAINSYPNAVFVGPKGGKIDGRGDAMLIAEYAKKVFLI